jgi:hypothetical protein
VPVAARLEALSRGPREFGCISGLQRDPVTQRFSGVRTREGDHTGATEPSATNAKPIEQERACIRIRTIAHWLASTGTAEQRQMALEIGTCAGADTASRATTQRR